MAIGDWEMAEDGTLPDSKGEFAPLQYPRSDAAREGTYPKVEEATEGVDENDGGTS